MKPCFAGDSLKIEYELYNEDDTIMDLSGKTFRWGIRVHGDPDTQINKTVGGGLTIIDAAAGRIDAQIDKAEISTPGNYIVELEASDGSWSKTVSRETLKLRPAMFTD